MKWPSRLLLATTIAVGALAPATSAAAAKPCGETGLIAATDRWSNLVIVDPAARNQRTLVQSRPHLIEAREATSPSWSGDGRSVAYAFNRRLVFFQTTSELRIDATDGTHRETVATVPVAGLITEVAFSPDGRRIAFVLHTRNYPVEIATWTTLGNRESVFVVNRDGTHLRPIASAAHFASDLAWAADGRHLAFTAIPSVVIADVNQAAPVAKPVTLPELISHSPQWSPDGRRLAFVATPTTKVASRTRVWITDAKGQQPRVLPVRSSESPTWSPDGRWLAAADDRSGIVAVSADGTARRQVTDTPHDRAPAWSPDGDAIAFLRGSGEVDDWASIWTVPVATGEADRVSERGWYSSPRWCPVP